MVQIIDIILLIAIITGIICTLIIIIDCHKNNKLIQEKYKKRDDKMYTRKQKEKYDDLDKNTLITIILDKEECIKNAIEYIKEKSNIEQWLEISNFELIDKLEKGLK